jgi:hypothetical protein
MRKNEVVGYVPKILFKVYLYLKNRFDPPKPVPEEEKVSYDICKKLILNQTSKLTIAPISNRRYIKNDDNNMFIVIAERTIKIINHIYSYTVYCEHDENYSELIKLFDNEVDSRRQELENEIQSNIQHSLKKILENLN